MIAAVARPQATVTLPSQHETVILAMDVSGSMKAEDVKPNRLVASQAAARGFINDTPRSTRIGVVAFAGSASLVQAPTANREDALAAIGQPPRSDSVAPLATPAPTPTASGTTVASPPAIRASMASGRRSFASFAMAR